MKQYLYVVALICFCKFASAQTAVQPAAETDKFSIEVSELSGKLNINWCDKKGLDVDYWEVQSSKEGTEFTTIGLVFGPEPGNKSNCFRFKQDKNKLEKGIVYFRVMPMIKGAASIPSNAVQVK